MQDADASLKQNTKTPGRVNIRATSHNMDTHYRSQTQNWDTIMALSTAIGSALDEHNWAHLLALVEQRDALVTEFFEQQVVPQLQDCVRRDVEKLKAQHALLQTQIGRQQQHSQAKQKQLEEVRQSLLDDATGLKSSAQHDAH